MSCVFNIFAKWDNLAMVEFQIEKFICTWFCLGEPQFDGVLVMILQIPNIRNVLKQTLIVNFVIFANMLRLAKTCRKKLSLWVRLKYKCLIFDLCAKFYLALLSKPATFSSLSNHHRIVVIIIIVVIVIIIKNIEIAKIFIFQLNWHLRELNKYHIHRLLHATQVNRGNRIPSGQGNTLNSLKLRVFSKGNAYFQSLY